MSPIHISLDLFHQEYLGVLFFHIHDINRLKLDLKALKCIFLEFSPIQKGYKCYHPPTKRKHVSMDINFSED